MNGWMLEDDELKKVWDWAEKHESSDKLAEAYISACGGAWATHLVACPDHIERASIRVRDFIGAKVLKHLA